jgi:hypothetical protein
VRTYADTSVFFSLYATDANSPKADVWRQGNPEALPFTALHRLELRNALGLAVFQGRLTAQEVQAAWLEVENDLAAGHLIPRGGLWHRTLGEAESLAMTHTPVVGGRTLDILHVAAAKLLGVPEFCSFDIRQTAVAARIGLKAVVP